MKRLTIQILMLTLVGTVIVGQALRNADIDGNWTGTIEVSGIKFRPQRPYPYSEEEVSYRNEKDNVQLVEVLTGLGDADCGYGFRLGGQYLVYANRNNETMLSTSICSRTRLLSEAMADLEYARGLSKAAPGGTILGEVKLRRGDTWPWPPVQDVRILLQGSNKQVEAKTNRAGKYTISGLPPGTYKVKIDLTEGLSIYNPEVEVEVHDRGCAQAFFFVEPDTRLTGKVLDAQGLSAADVLMELVPVSREDNGFPSYVRTDKEGRYEMKLLKPGRYHLGVRVAGSAGSTYVPFHKLITLE